MKKSVLYPAVALVGAFALAGCSREEVRVRVTEVSGSFGGPLPANAKQYDFTCRSGTRVVSGSIETEPSSVPRFVSSNGNMAIANGGRVIEMDGLPASAICVWNPR